MAPEGDGIKGNPPYADDPSRDRYYIVPDGEAIDRNPRTEPQLSLSQKLTQDPEKRKTLIKDATKVLEAEVDSKSGMSGLAVKGVFKVVKGLQPGFIPKAIDDLLDEFVQRVEPFYDQWNADNENRDLRGHFVHHGSAVADALLGVTDERAKHSKHRKLVKAYEKLRPKGKEHVQAAMSRVGSMIDRQTVEYR